MAELEYGRWNNERLQDGWRYGKTKDEDRKLSPFLVCWKDLSDGDNGVKKYDRTAVGAFPKILAKAGWRFIGTRRRRSPRKRAARSDGPYFGWATVTAGCPATTPSPPTSRRQRFAASSRIHRVALVC